jgi:predicted component of type VI protein secretion system
VLDLSGFTSVGLKVPSTPGALGAGPAPAPAPLSAGATAAVERALSDAALDLDLLYASYRGSWEQLRSQLSQLLGPMDAASRAAAARRIVDRYPEASREPQFRELAGTAAPSPSAERVAAPAPWPAASGGASEAEQLLTAFAESYLPPSASIRGPEDTQAFLGRLAEALEAFSRSFVEMRKGYEEFGKQMGVRTVHGDGPVQRARDPRQLIAALLDPAQHGRAGELQAAFADYMVHQVALLNGVAEGAKAMLAQLSPEDIEARAPQKSMWPMKGQALWKAFEERWHRLVDEEDAISDALFGREFGKAYTAMIGQRVGAEPSEDDEDEDGGAPRGGSRGRGPRR